MPRPTGASPAPHPCASCPYRRDVPSGVWEAHEYEKLPPYDGETGDQPPAVFFCHQQNGRLCAGWVGCHDMHESLGLRMAAAWGVITPEDYKAALDYESPVPLFATGAEAAKHGLAQLARPGPEAHRAMSKIQRRRSRREETK